MLEGEHDAAGLRLAVCDGQVLGLPVRRQLVPAVTRDFKCCSWAALRRLWAPAAFTVTTGKTRPWQPSGQAANTAASALMDCIAHTTLCSHEGRRRGAARPAPPHYAARGPYMAAPRSAGRTWAGEGRDCCPLRPQGPAPPAGPPPPGPHPQSRPRRRWPCAQAGTCRQLVRRPAIWRAQSSSQRRRQRTWSSPALVKPLHRGRIAVRDDLLQPYRQALSVLRACWPVS